MLEELETLGRKIGASTTREVKQAVKAVEKTVQTGATEAEIVAKKAQAATHQTAAATKKAVSKGATNAQKTVKSAVASAKKTATKPATKTARKK